MRYDTERLSWGDIKGHAVYKLLYWHALQLKHWLSEYMRNESFQYVLLYPFICTVAATAIC